MRPQLFNESHSSDIAVAGDPAATERLKLQQRDIYATSECAFAAIGLPDGLSAFTASDVA